MGLDNRLKGHGKDECQCGRRASIVHCTICGSYRTYGYAGIHPEVNAAGVTLYTKKYRCMKCGHVFSDVERGENGMFCTAPFVETKTIAAARQIKIMREAKVNGHPLTNKEEIIARGVDVDIDLQQRPDESASDYLDRREAALIARGNGQEVPIPTVKKSMTKEELAVETYIRMMQKNPPDATKKLAYDLARRVLGDNQIIDIDKQYGWR